ncbi:MAG: DUF445 domain-containing protein [Saezia sp.]
MEKTKRIATLLLFLMAALFVLSKRMEHQAIYWGYIAAFAEAGLIGAIADWFAIVALFRHPLGIPIPHTAIIPANRDRIAERLAEFLCLKFLDAEQIAHHLGLNDPVKSFACWLAQPTNARKVAGSVCKSIEHILPLLENQQIKDFVQERALQGIHQVNLATSSKELLNLLVQKNQHQILLEKAVIQTGKLLADEDVRDQIATAVASEVKYLRFIGLDAAAGRYATRTMVSTVAHLMEEMAQDPEHPFRKRFETYIFKLIDELDTDESRKEQLQRIQQKIAEQPQVIKAFSQLWDHALQWLRTDCETPYPLTQNHLEQALQNMARQLQSDDEISTWINQKIFTLLPQWISRYRKTIHKYIINTVQAWTPEEMSQGLEKYIGRDLQFIRINGTLVGGLVGLLIHTILQVI